MERFMLLLHEDPTAFAAVTPEEIGRVIARYQAWSADLAQKDQLVGGEKLAEEGGRVLKRNGGGKLQVTDGPYAEAKEVVGGYFLIQAADYEEAAMIASTCPHIDYGWIELRKIENIPG